MIETLVIVTAPLQCSAVQYSAVQCRSVWFNAMHRGKTVRDKVDGDFLTEGRPHLGDLEGGQAAGEGQEVDDVDDGVEATDDYGEYLCVPHRW